MFPRRLLTIVVLTVLAGCANETAVPEPADQEERTKEAAEESTEQVEAVPVAEVPLRPALQSGSPSVVP